MHLALLKPDSLKDLSARVRTTISIGAHHCTTTALLDTGAEAQSYIGKQLADTQFQSISRSKVNRQVRLAGSETVVQLQESIRLPVTLTIPTGGTTTALLDLDILDTDIALIIGFPDIIRHYKQVLSSIMDMAGKILLESDKARATTLSYITDMARLRPDTASDALQLPTGAINPDWVLPYIEPEEERLIEQHSIFPEFPEFDKRNSEFLSVLPTRILSPQSDEQAKLLELLLDDKYREIFVWRSWKFIDVPPIRLNWKPGVPDHFHSAPRPCAIPKQAEAAVAINRFETQGYWKRTGITPRYATPVVLVWKPDRTIRVCADYPLFVNKWLAPFQAPSPDIHLELERMASFRSYINVDLKDGYYGIGLSAEDCERLTVTTHLGNFVPLAVPMGITVGGAILQAVAQDVFSPLAERSIVMQDNLLIGIREGEDPIPILRQLLEICLLRRVTLNIKKCEFCTTTAQFWGYILTPGHYAIDPERKQGLKQLQFPDSLKAAQRFCGLANFYSGFIPNYRAVVEPLLPMLRAGFPWHAPPAETKVAFTAIIAAMDNSIDLSMARRDVGPWILRADASKTGVAAVLLQRIPVNSMYAIGKAEQEEPGFQLQPVALASFPLTEAARRNWHTHTSELYAIMMALKRWKTLIDTHPIIIESDHRNLLFTQEHHSALTHRWISYIQSNFHIVAFLHRPGILNTLADTLSRLYMITALDATSILQSYDDASKAVIAIAGSSARRVDVREADLQDIAKLATAVDEARAGLWTARLQSPRDGAAGAASPSLSALTAEAAFEKVHNARQGHVGWRRTYARLKQQHPEVQVGARTVRQLVEDCPVCLKYRTTIREPQAQEVLHALPIIAQAGLVTVDTFKLPQDTHGNNFILMIVNHQTKMVDPVPMRAKTSKDVTLALYAHMCTEGAPSMILTDPGTELNNADVNSLLSWLGVEHHTTIAKRPQAHGTERSIGKFKLHLAVLVGSETARDRWSDRSILPAIRLILNSSHNDEINAIPLHLRFGTAAAQKYKKITDPNEEPPRIASTELIASLDAALQALQTTADKFNAFRKNHRKQRGLPSDRLHSYQQGDYILWKSDALLLEEGPLTSRLHGPYRVLSQEGNIITAQHCSNGKTYDLHHERCHIFTDNEDIAKEVARQDFPDQHSIVQITAHKGTLEARESLSFYTMFSDDDQAWLPYTEVKDTVALDTYAKTRTCTRVLLLPTTQDVEATERRYKTVNLPTLVGTLRSIDGYSLPSIAEVIYVSYHAFSHEPFHAATLPDLQFKEYFLSAKVIKITPRRFDIRFTQLSYTVAWSLHKVVAYVQRHLSPNDILLDKDMLEAHPQLFAALRA